MRWYHSTKTAKIFWVTLDGATNGASIRGVCKYYIGPSVTSLCRLPQPPARNWPPMYSFFAQKWYGLLSFWALLWLQARILLWNHACCTLLWVVGWYTEAVGGGGGVLVSNDWFFITKHNSITFGTFFNDSVQTVYARGGDGSRQTEVADGADVLIYRHQSINCPMHSYI